MPGCSSCQAVKEKDIKFLILRRHYEDMFLLVAPHGGYPGDRQLVHQL